ncbi:hypothetical protein GCM10010215_34870 [Streptomyces virginiae]|uniref:Uncharacterized protein n=1 Tax=Streptomyces virginiae TaxID=1961 RepID=A0ABQ3NPF4_STRVG|nr:hypothetical protein GCM10010215_34870 [Streptomyces virginiae]GHI14665.1 hypothetical protein Scinn_41280 [Streptomyces virginiae]
MQNSARATATKAPFRRAAGEVSARMGEFLSADAEAHANAPARRAPARTSSPHCGAPCAGPQSGSAADGAVWQRCAFGNTPRTKAKDSLKRRSDSPAMVRS